MSKKIIIVLLGFLLLLACKKDQTQGACSGVQMTGSKEVFVGKSIWYNTVVKEWFDVGTPIYHDYTPATEGFNYYFVITEDGKYKGYKNDTLIHDFILDKIDFESFNPSLNALTLS